MNPGFNIGIKLLIGSVLSILLGIFIIIKSKRCHDLAMIGLYFCLLGTCLLGFGLGGVIPPNILRKMMFMK